MRGLRVAAGRCVLSRAATPLVGVCLLVAALGPSAPGRPPPAVGAQPIAANAHPAAGPLVTFDDLGAVGGAYGPVAFAGPGRVLVGMDNRVGVLDTSRPEVPRVVHRSAPLPEVVTDIVVVGGRAWIAAGGAGLFTMSLDTDTPEPGPPVTLPGSVERLAVDPPFVLAATTSGAVLMSADDPTLLASFGAGPVTDVALARFTAYVLQVDQILVFDVTKPALPKEARAVRLEASGTAIAASRSLLLVSDAESALRVYGLDNPRNPRRRGALDSSYLVHDILPVGVYAYLASDAGLRAVHILAEPMERNFGRPQTVHPAKALATDGTYLIVTGDRGLDVEDVRQPAGPRRVGSLPVMTDAFEVSLRDGVLYAAGSGALTLADVDPATESHVLSLLELRYPETVAHIGNYALVGDGHVMYVVDVSEPTLPRLVSALPVINAASGGQNEYVTDIQVSGNTAFLANGRFGGLTVVDVTSPTLPVPAAVMTTTGFATKLALTGPEGSEPTLALVGDSQEGLIAYDIRTPEAAVRVAASGGTWFPFGFAVWGDLVVVVAGEDGMQFYEVQSDPALPDFGRMKRVTSWWPGVSARALAIQDGIAYAGGDPDSGCRIVAVSLADPSDPREVGCWPAAGAVDTVTVAGDLMAVSAYGMGVGLVQLNRASGTATPTSIPTQPPPEVTPTATGERPRSEAYLPALWTEGQSSPISPAD